MDIKNINNLVGKWNEYYLNNPIPRRMGSELTYKIGMEFLNDCFDVEDWGGGTGYSKKYCKTKNYKRIDGSESSGADVITDLRYYKSSVDGILIRHVLDHNPEWNIILMNAIESFKKKLCVIIGSSFKDSTMIVNIISNRYIADIQFKKDDIEKYFGNLKYQSLSIDGEELFLIEAPYD